MSADTNKIARPIALAILERLDVLMCIENKNDRVNRAQVEVTAIIASELTTFAEGVRAEQKESRCQDL